MGMIFVVKFSWSEICCSRSFIWFLVVNKLKLTIITFISLIFFCTSGLCQYPDWTIPLCKWRFTSVSHPHLKSAVEWQMSFSTAFVSAECMNVTCKPGLDTFLGYVSEEVEPPASINNRVVDTRKFVSLPILVQRRFVDLDVDGFLLSSFEITWFLVQFTHFI